MDRALKLINVLYLLLAVNIKPKLTFANTTLTVINSNVSTESTTNQETTIEFTTMSSIVTPNTGISPETTFMKSKHNRSNSIMFECSLELVDVGVVQKIKALVAENKELIFIHFHLLNQTPILLGPNDSIYDILTVVRTAGGFGNELLEMHPQFEQLSIGTLMFGVEHLNIALRIMSRGCSRQEELQSALLSIVTTELNMVQMGNDNEFTRLCQMHAENVNGIAAFYYNCCRVEGNGEFVCNRLEINQWMTILLFSMNICYGIAFLCSPLLIPTSWYDTNAHEITLRIEDTFEIRLSNGNLLTKIKNAQTRQQIINSLNNKYKFPLKAKEIKLKMLEMNTVSTDYVPAGIFHYLYRTFIKCQVKDHEYVKDCCHADVCTCTKHKREKKYESFSQAVIDFSISNMEKQVKETFSGKNELQHSAFQFKILNKSSNDSHIKILFDVSRKKLLLKSKQPCLFFDENCKPYLNEKAFFTMCYMKVIRAPGSLWTNYKSAAINFLVIVFFLFSVVTIVLAFGKTQGIPGTYQAIATLGGGLIPLVLRRHFFKSDDVFDFETNHFLVDDELQQLFETYHETWEIVDIPVDTDHEDGETTFVIEIREARDNSQSEDAKRPTIFPCGSCGKAERKNQKGILCDGCTQWFHVKCIELPLDEYTELSKSTDDWYCRTCTLPEFTNSFFHMIKEEESNAPSTNYLPSISDVNNNPGIETDESEYDIFKDLVKLGRDAPTNIICAYLNINSYSYKFESIIDLLNRNIVDILFLSEKKLDDSFPDAMFTVENFLFYRSDRNKYGGGVLAYMRSDLAGDRNKQAEFQDIESIALEVTTEDNKWLFIGAYKQPSMPDSKFRTDFNLTTDKVIKNIN
ncbi:Hypothetical predicted protein [Mytilus galloprovincialis]|uniref:PHD-type domain-containing protein n=1 Tax=Mytilus galloprovincialis TaxID=29158 RepID=A0A8B6HPK5_MYTGA|nr:Hypothetical predicted protein [Mytilus galloprovincialis]